MANHYRLLKLQFHRKGEEAIAVTGTDAIVHVDGRFSKARAYGELQAHARDYVSKNPSLEWRGVVYQFATSRDMLVTPLRLELIKK